VDEKKLIAGAKNGDESAFEELVRRYRKPIYHLLYRLVADYMEAADLTQEVFVKMWQKLSNLRGEGSFKSWLYRIAVNEAKNHFRAKKRRKWVPLSPKLPALDNPEKSTLAGERKKALLSAVERLPEKQRISLVLRVWEGMDFAEIAEVMGSSAATARANYHFALVNLKKIIKKR